MEIKTFENEAKNSKNTENKKREKQPFRKSFLFPFQILFFPKNVCHFELKKTRYERENYIAAKKIAARMRRISEERIFEENSRKNKNYRM